MERTFTFYGRFTIGYAGLLLARVAELLTDPLPEEVVLDLSRVEFIDTFGVNLLAACCHTVLESDSKGYVDPPKNEKVNDYLLDMGLYESLGMGRSFKP